MNDVNKVQLELVDEISKPTTQKTVLPKDKETFSLLNLLSNYKEEYFDVFGAKKDLILGFLDAVDFQHPDMKNVFDSESLRALLKIMRAKHATIFTQNALFENILKKSSLSFYKEYLGHINDPRKSQKHIRLIKDEEDRNKARKTKVPLYVNLQSFFKEDSEWENIDAIIPLYYRNNKGYKEEIKKAQNKIEKYESFGCTSLADLIKSSLKEYKDSFENNSYYGFYKIKVANVAAYLARLLEGKLSTTSNKKLVNNKKIYVYKNGKRELYNPFLCPIEYLKDYCPSNVKKIISSLESHPDLNGYCMFDNYLVVVPHTSNKIKSGVVEDKYIKMINSDLVAPIVLGEKDGDCYFVCYWM